MRENQRDGEDASRASTPYARRAASNLERRSGLSLARIPRVARCRCTLRRSIKRPAASESRRHISQACSRMSSSGEERWPWRSAGSRTPMILGHLNDTPGPALLGLLQAPGPRTGAGAPIS